MKAVGTLDNFERGTRNYMGPAAVMACIGVRWVLPIHAVAYPFNRKIPSTVAALRGTEALYPGNPADASGTLPIPTACALRPVSNAARDAAHTGVVWKLV